MSVHMSLQKAHISYHRCICLSPKLSQQAPEIDFSGHHRESLGLRQNAAA